MAKIKFLRGSGGGRPLEGHKGNGNSLSIIKKDKKHSNSSCSRSSKRCERKGERGIEFCDESAKEEGTRMIDP
jgi:hypothetical protein